MKPKNTVTKVKQGKCKPVGIRIGISGWTYQPWRGAFSLDAEEGVKIGVTADEHDRGQWIFLFIETPKKTITPGTMSRGGGEVYPPKCVPVGHRAEFL